ncbi:MAG: nickel-dependent lactate racemase [Bacteroidota bacterium]
MTTSFPSIHTAGMRPAPAPIPGEQAIPSALADPIASRPLGEIASEAVHPQAEAVIVVSDNTRPVPYRGKGGLMRHIIQTLLDAGWLEQQIVVLIGAGSHRNMVGQEVEEMLGLQESGFASVRIENHEYDREDHLLYVGETKRGSLVKINKRYMDADLKIVTGLVESHFMAGASGGRKGICPGIVGKETLSIFHGAKLLNSSQAADLILEGNPLHDEALEVALMAGCDFLVNATIDEERRLNGVFAGDLTAAHKEAVQFIRNYVTVDLDHRYDIVVIPGGYVGINHYQVGKAAVEAAKAVKAGGWIIISAQNTDVDPVGGTGYKQAMALFRQHGREAFMEMIAAPDWSMIPEQWQVQMWCKVLRVIEEEDHLIYCALEIPRQDYANLPGQVGLDLLTQSEHDSLSKEQRMALMQERAIAHAWAQLGNPQARILYLKDGPYGIPHIKGE